MHEQIREASLANAMLGRRRLPCPEDPAGLTRALWVLSQEQGRRAPRLCATVCVHALRVMMICAGKHVSAEVFMYQNLA